MFGKKDIRNLSVNDCIWIEDGFEELLVVDLLHILNGKIMVVSTANRLNPVMICNVRDITHINGKEIER